MIRRSNTNRLDRKSDELHNNRDAATISTPGGRECKSSDSRRGASVNVQALDNELRFTPSPMANGRWETKGGR